MTSRKFEVSDKDQDPQDHGSDTHATEEHREDDGARSDEVLATPPPLEAEPDASATLDAPASLDPDEAISSEPAAHEEPVKLDGSPAPPPSAPLPRTHLAAMIGELRGPLFPTSGVVITSSLPNGAVLVTRHGAGPDSAVILPPEVATSYIRFVGHGSDAQVDRLNALAERLRLI